MRLHRLHMPRSLPEWRLGLELRRSVSERDMSGRVCKDLAGCLLGCPHRKKQNTNIRCCGLDCKWAIQNTRGQCGRRTQTTQNTCGQCGRSTQTTRIRKSLLPMRLVVQQPIYVMPHCPNAFVFHYVRYRTHI
jgi:hypothetical protein